MSQTDIIALIVTIIGVLAFALVISILYKHYIDTSISQIERGDRDIEFIDKLIYENNPKVRKKQKATEIVKNVFYYAFLAFLIPIFGLSIYSKIKNNVTSFGGNSLLVVASGSMSKKDPSNTYLFNYDLNNQFQTYDMIVVNKVKEVTDLKVYDVIAYRNDKGINIIHRIKDIKTNSDGEIYFITRGDANSGDDVYHPVFKDIIGRYNNKRIPGLGIFVMFFQSYIGIIAIASVVYMMIYINIYNRKLDNVIYEREMMLDKLFDVEKLNDETYKEMELNIESSLFYRGETYIFDRNGFKEKHLMTEEEKQLFDNLQKESNTEIVVNKQTKEDVKYGKDKEK